MKSGIIAMAAALLVAPLLVRAGVSNENVHLLAKQSVILSRNGVDVPKVYVLTSGGDVIFEGAASKNQPFEPILKSIQSGKVSARKSTAIFALLKAAGFKPAANGKPVVVSLEIGSTMGECTSCKPFYPELAKYLARHDLDVRWIHMVFEKNDYKAPKKG